MGNICHTHTHTHTHTQRNDNARQYPESPEQLIIISKNERALYSSHLILSES